MRRAVLLLRFCGCTVISNCCTGPKHTITAKLLPCWTHRIRKEIRRDRNRKSIRHKLNRQHTKLIVEANSFQRYSEWATIITPAGSWYNFQFTNSIPRKFVRKSKCIVNMWPKNHEICLTFSQYRMPAGAAYWLGSAWTYTCKYDHQMLQHVGSYTLPVKTTHLAALISLYAEVKKWRCGEFGMVYRFIYGPYLHANLGVIMRVNMVF